MLRLSLSSLSLSLLWSGALVLAACPSKTTGGAGGGGDDDDVDVAWVNQRESARAAAKDFAPALRSDDAALRARAVRALGRLERLDAVAGIVAALGDASAAVRAEAAFAAGQVDLAIDPTRPTHEEQRGVVETALVTALIKEQDSTVRAALVRALGRVASKSGLDQLVQRASSSSPTEAAEALTALGVSGARRQASRQGDEALRAAVTRGIEGKDEGVRAAAAYAAFRQRLPLSSTTVTAALSAGDQTRIFVTRALGAALSNGTFPTASDVADAALPKLFVDKDWRVQVEAARVAAARNDLKVDVTNALDAAVKAQKQPGALLVATEVCLAISTVGAPPTALTPVQSAIAALPASSQARCTCAATAEVLGGDPHSVESCTAALPKEQQEKFAVLALEHARVNSGEKASGLAPYLASDNTRVRIAAAAALCAEPATAAADAAATRLLEETDPGVASALLECFADGENAEVIRDRTLVTAAQRFTSGATFEELEPLLGIAALSRKRPGATMASLRETLAQHPDARVKDAANDVAGGDRAPGPRALVLPAPPPGTLPLAAILHTNRGDVTIAFEREVAPRTVKSFVDLAGKGTFNNTPFHRVVADFVDQTGDPRGDGSGGPGFTIPCENSDLPFVRGAVGMAHAGKDTGGSQFFLTQSHQPHLDGRYTLFAHVVDGEAVMDSLQKDDVLQSVEITTALRGLAR